MRVISVRQPWAWAIFNAGKDVENRSFRNIVTGPLAIHVSKFNRWSEIATNLDGAFANGLLGDLKYLNFDPLDKQRGKIIGLVDVVDCVRDSSSKWAEPGKWHWLLENPRLVCPVPAKGMLSMFNYTGQLEMLK